MIDQILANVFAYFFVTAFAITVIYCALEILINLVFSVTMAIYYALGMLRLAVWYALRALWKWVYQ